MYTECLYDTSAMKIYLARRNFWHTYTNIFQKIGYYTTCRGISTQLATWLVTFWTRIVLLIGLLNQQWSRLFTCWLWSDPCYFGINFTVHTIVTYYWVYMSLYTDHHCCFTITVMWDSVGPYAFVFCSYRDYDSCGLRRKLDPLKL